MRVVFLNYWRLKLANIQTKYEEETEGVASLTLGPNPQKACASHPRRQLRD